MTAPAHFPAPEAPPLSRVTLADIPEALARIAALEQDAHADREWVADLENGLGGLADRLAGQARTHEAALADHGGRLLVLERRLPDLAALAALRARAEKVEALAETLVRLAEAAAADAARAVEAGRSRPAAAGKVGPRRAWYKRILGLSEGV